MASARSSAKAILEQRPNLYEMANVESISINGEKLYKCIRCPETSKRRYNAERHYRRFHESVFPAKTCCGKSFCIKSDFYKHKEIIHNETKKYLKERDQNIKVGSKDTVARCNVTFCVKKKFYDHEEVDDKENKPKSEKKKDLKRQDRKIKMKKQYEEIKENIKKRDKKIKVEQDTETSMELSETQNNNELSRLVHLHQSPPKKFFLNKWQNNISTRTLWKRAHPPRKIIASKSLEKETVKMYNITDLLEKGIVEGLFSGSTYFR